MKLNLVNQDGASDGLSDDRRVSGKQVDKRILAMARQTGKQRMTFKAFTGIDLEVFEDDTTGISNPPNHTKETVKKEAV